MKLEVKNLSKSFGDKNVLSDVSFTVESGSALGLLGRNGAGKTTTIRIIMGVFGSGGEILADGRKINRSEINFGYLPEERGLYPKKPILEQLVYFGVLRGMTTKKARSSALIWLERLGMEEYKNSSLDKLSKGNQQKIQLACTLVTNPDIVILDEPFSGLDPVNAMLLKDVVRELIDKGKLVIFSSHQMNYVEEFCDSIAILNKGRLVLSGRIQDIKHSYDRKKLVITSEEAEKMELSVREKLSDYIVSSQLNGQKLMVELKAEEDKAAFTKEIASLGVDFDGINVYEPTLNDIFVEYTEDKN